MRGIGNRFLAFLLTAALCLGLLGCGARTGESVSPEETENLVKLCKVWGYTKYRHPAFLLGKKDWDAELLDLIPQVREAETSEAVNKLLHTWFVELGEIDYGTDLLSPAWRLAEEEDKLLIADTVWTTDAAYLGVELAADFARLPEVIPNTPRLNGPVQESGSALNGINREESFFINEPEHTIKYSEDGFRLLGLFRLWNAVEYYGAYVDRADQEWTQLLREQIPLMLSIKDQASYETVIASVISQTMDPHASLRWEKGGKFYYYFMKLGRYCFPVPLTAVDGDLVVSGSEKGCLLELGDILCAIDGKEVDALIEERKLYCPYSREDAILQNQAYITITRSSKHRANVTVLRDGEEVTVPVKWNRDLLPKDTRPSEVSHKLLDGNIGLINPDVFSPEETSDVMDSFRNTQGLIIDLRQYPTEFSISSILQYFGCESTKFTIVDPSMEIPGVYLKKTFMFPALVGNSYQRLEGKSYHYDKPVVVLCDETSISSSELHIEALRQAENITVIGSNTAGGFGAPVSLPLPGGLKAGFSISRFYAVDSEDMQRVGITPDIHVEPTIQGIKEGRDEVLEAAVEYIKNTVND